MIVLLVANLQNESALEVSLSAMEILQGAGAEILLPQEAEGYFPPGLPARYLPMAMASQSCDYLVTVGGDGTMLHAARHSIHAGKPLLGINSGRLGFLAIIEKNELEKLHRLFSGDFRVENRSVIQAKSAGLHCEALNDIVLFKALPEKTISLNIFCDDVLVSRFRGDGVIFSTPTGSTAYSMSAGGPIVDAKLGGIIVTQICAHVVQNPPMVFDSSRELRVVSSGPEQETILMSCDGMPSQQVGHDEPIIITQSPLAVPLVQFSDADQLKSIDKKLKGR